MSILPNFVFADMRVTACARQSHGQVEAWTLRAIQRWQHPLQPNNNWHRARHDELTLECVWKQGGTDKVDRITMDKLNRQAGNTTGQCLPFPPPRGSGGAATRPGYPTAPLSPACPGPTDAAARKLGGGNGREPEPTARVAQADGRKNYCRNIQDF